MKVCSSYTFVDLDDRLASPEVSETWRAEAEVTEAESKDREAKTVPGPGCYS